MIDSSLVNLALRIVVYGSILLVVILVYMFSLYTLKAKEESKRTCRRDDIDCVDDGVSDNTLVMLRELDKGRFARREIWGKETYLFKIPSELIEDIKELDGELQSKLLKIEKSAEKEFISIQSYLALYDKGEIIKGYSLKDIDKKAEDWIVSKNPIKDDVKGEIS